MSRYTSYAQPLMKRLFGRLGNQGFHTKYGKTTCVLACFFLHQAKYLFENKEKVKQGI
jgi:hypothetical protein